MIERIKYKENEKRKSSKIENLKNKFKKSIIWVLIWVSLLNWNNSVQAHDYWIDRNNLWYELERWNNILWISHLEWYLDLKSSIGEFKAVNALIDTLIQKFTDYRVLVTTVTATGSQSVIDTYQSKVLHYYLPLDLPIIVNKYIIVLW